MPPHDLDAEAAVLSAAILDRGALDRVVGVVKAAHFYSEANSRIYEAMLALAEVGTPVDLVTIAAWLRDRERLAAVGGPAYLAQIVDATPAIAHVMEHAERIVERSLIRRTIATCQRIAAEGYGRVDDARGFVDGAEGALFELAHGDGAPRSTVPLRDALTRTFEGFARVAASGERTTGRATGYERYDAMTAGLHDGDLSIVAARPGMGKAQPTDEPVLTPTGWRRIGTLREGDLVVGADGRPARVLGVYPQGRKPVFRVELTDGGWTRCCDEHLWVIRDRSARRRGLPGAVRTTSEIRGTLSRSDSGGTNHSIPVAAPAELESMGELPMHPYVLGVLLGDGCLSRGTVVCKPDEDVRQRVARHLPVTEEVSEMDEGGTWSIRARSGHREYRTRDALRALALFGTRSWEKHIPEMYLRASIEDRWELLRGMLDTDGSVVGPKVVEFSTASPMLAVAMEYLVGTLGGISTTNIGPAQYRDEAGTIVPCRDRHRMLLRWPAGGAMPVTSSKHVAKWDRSAHRTPERYIAAVTPDGEEECVCIRVDAADQLYVTRNFLVTHNTSFVLNVAVNVASPRPALAPQTELRQGFGVFFASLEMPTEQLSTRMICSEARVDLGKLRQGQLRADDWSRLTEAASFLSTLPIWLDDTPAITLLDLRSKVRRVQAEYNRGVPGSPEERRLGLVVVDYLQLMKGRDGAQNREQEISELSRGLKALAKELCVPVIALSQLNRAVETRSTKDKRPQLSDLRDSGAIEQDADNITFIYRDEYYFSDSKQRGLAELIVAKQRNGPTGKVFTRFFAGCTRFDNLAAADYPTTNDDA